MATTSTSVADTTVHFRLSNISKNLTFGKIAKKSRSPERYRTGAIARRTYGSGPGPCRMLQASFR